MVNSFGVMLYKGTWDKLLLCFSALEVDGLALYQLQGLPEHKSNQRAAILAGVFAAAWWGAHVLGGMG